MSSRSLRWSGQGYDLGTDSKPSYATPPALRALRGSGGAHRPGGGRETGKQASPTGHSRRGRPDDPTLPPGTKEGEERRAGVIRLSSDKTKIKVKKYYLILSKRVTCFPFLDHMFIQCFACARDCGGHREEVANCQAGLALRTCEAQKGRWTRKKETRNQ